MVVYARHEPEALLENSFLGQMQHRDYVAASNISCHIDNYIDLVTLWLKHRRLRWHEHHSLDLFFMSEQRLVFGKCPSHCHQGRNQSLDIWRQLGYLSAAEYGVQ